MNTLEKALAEIEDLQQQAADIMDAITRIQEKHGIWCRNCHFGGVICDRHEHFPECFRPNEKWRERYENERRKP